MELQVQFPIRCSLCHEPVTELELRIEGDGHHEDPNTDGEGLRELQKNKVPLSVMDQEFTPNNPKLDTEDTKR